MKTKPITDLEIHSVKLDEDSKFPVIVDFDENEIDEEAEEKKEEETALQVITDEDGQESEEENDTMIGNHRIRGHRNPHKDLVTSFGKLRRHALAICEISDENAADYQVLEFVLKGSMKDKKARVKLVIRKWRREAKKYTSPWNVDIALFTKSDYKSSAALVTIIEEILDETKQYLGGKYDVKGQLPLFERTLMKAS